MTEILGICHTIAAAILVGSVGWAAYLIAVRLDPQGPVAIRSATALLIAGVIPYVVFKCLLSLGVFRLWPALGASALVAIVLDVAARGAEARARLRKDLRAVVARLSSTARSPLGVLLILCAAVAILRAMRGMVAPPLACDALTYHLFKAGRWVHYGRDIRAAAPDAWGYYEYYPGAADSYWAWALLIARDGAMLAPAGFAIWAAIVLAGYAAARVIGARERMAILFAFAIATTPAVINAITASYAENTLLAFFLLGLCFMMRFLSTAAPGDAALAALGFGMATNVRMTMLLILALGWAATALPAVRTGSNRKRGAIAAANYTAIALVLLVAEYVKVWIEKGSPLYPIHVSIAGITLSRGNEELRLALRGPQIGIYSAWRLVSDLFLPRFFQHGDSLGLGMLAPILVVMGIVGVLKLLSRDGRKSQIAFAAIAALLLLWPLVSPDSRGLRTAWGYVFARFTLPLFALLTLFASILETPVAIGLWALDVTANLALAIPWGWTSVDLTAVVELALLAGCGIVLAIGFRRTSARASLPRIVTAIVAVLLIVMPISASLPSLRESFRYRFYAASIRARPAYDLTPFGYLASWPVWKFVDDGASHRIAVAVGWDGAIGDNWLTYPLLGSGLQNEVLYVPVTRDGRIIDYAQRGAFEAYADFDAWVQRLRAEKIEYVVTLVPPPPEKQWIDGSSALFERVFTAANGASVYQFDRKAAVVR